MVITREPLSPNGEVYGLIIATLTCYESNVGDLGSSYGSPNFRIFHLVKTTSIALSIARCAGKLIPKNITQVVLNTSNIPEFAPSLGSHPTFLQVESDPLV